MTTVLYVDDESTIRRAVELWLSRYGVAVHSAASVHDAKVVIAEHHLDGVFIDVWLEDGSGFDLFDWLRAEHATLARRVAFVTGDTVATDDTQRRLHATGCPVLVKPFDLDELKDVAARWARGGRGGEAFRREEAG